MFVNVTMSDTDIKKIFARTEGDLIYGESDHIIFSTRVMLINLFKQLPESLQDDIRRRNPRTTEQIESQMKAEGNGNNERGKSNAERNRSYGTQ